MMEKAVSLLPQMWNITVGMKQVEAILNCFYVFTGMNCFSM